MAARISSAFSAARARGAPAFVAYLTAGFPHAADTVPALLAMQAEGVDVVELGVPFSDPMADGGTIQAANMVALANGVTLRGVLAMVKEARAAGVTLRECHCDRERARARARTRAREATANARAHVRARARARDELEARKACRAGRRGGGARGARRAARREPGAGGRLNAGSGAQPQSRRRGLEWSALARPGQSARCPAPSAVLTRSGNRGRVHPDRCVGGGIWA